LITAQTRWQFKLPQNLSVRELGGVAGKAIKVLAPANLMLVPELVVERISEGALATVL
jgi:hypothetical protein